MNGVGPASGRSRGARGQAQRRLAPGLKRFVDVLGSGAALIAFSPVIAVVALAVRVTAGSPVLFSQVRPGLHGHPFTIRKFRTMREPRPGEDRYFTDDERMTRLGAFLRTTSLDELPELWNVLRGDMSLVGPRPLLPEYLDTYSPDEHRRHEMRPGITGWAVVNGRNTLAFQDRLALDLWYVDHWSLALDARILARTVALVLRRDGATPTERLDLGFPLERPEPAVDAGPPSPPAEGSPARSAGPTGLDGGAEEPRPSPR